MAVHIAAAHCGCGAAAVSGKAVMPFRLDAILKRTGGASLVTNVALVNRPRGHASSPPLRGRALPTLRGAGGSGGGGDGRG